MMYVYVFRYMCVYIYMCTYIYIYMYMCVHIHVNTYQMNLSIVFWDFLHDQLKNNACTRA